MTTDLPAGDTAPPAALTSPRIRIDLRAFSVSWVDIVLCLVLFGIAMAPRAAWVAHVDRPPQGINDPGLYDTYSDNIADGKGYRGLRADPTGTYLIITDKTAYYPVGYPATVAGLKKAGDFAITPWERGDFSVKMMNAVFGAVTVVAVFLLASRIFDRRVGTAAGLLLAAFPSQVFYTGTYLSETEFTMLMMLGILALAWNPWSRDGMPYGQLALAGVILSFATMVRGITLLLPLVLFAIWFFYLHDRTRALKQTLVLFAGIAVLIVPWSVRNTLAMQTLTGPSTNVGDDLCIGNYLGARGAFTITGKCFEGSFEDKVGREFEVGRNRHGTETAIKDVVQHPLRMPKLILDKAYWLLYTDDDGLWAVESYGHDYFISHPRREILQFAANGYYYATGLVVLAGALAFAMGRDIRRLFVLACMLYVIAIPLIFFGDPRFHHPMIPLATVIAGWTIVTFWSRRRLARGEPEPLPVRSQKPQSLDYCQECGLRLLPAQDRCPSCGTAREGRAP
jgi:hypothetical protein